MITNIHRIDRLNKYRGEIDRLNKYRGLKFYYKLISFASKKVNH